MKKLLAISFLTAISALAFAGEPSFSGIEEGDRIEMTEHSTGCFHDTTCYYEVKMTGGVCYFTEYALAWHPIQAGVVTEKKVVGTVQLTEKDLAGLDGLLRYYRGKKTAGSTTFVTLAVEYFEAGKRIGVENLEDGSGGYELDKKPGVTSFYELTKRFQKPGS